MPGYLRGYRFGFLRGVKILHPPLVKATILARTTIWCYGIYAVVQGVVLAWAADERFQGDSYEVLRAVTGGMNTWGFLVLACGLAMLFGSLRRQFWTKTVGVAGLSLWFGMFAFGQLWGVLASPNAAPAAPATYLLLACGSSVLLLVEEKDPLP